MRVIFAGTPEVAVPSLDALAASRHDLVAVVTRPDAPQRRSKRLVPSPVARWAAERGIETLQPARPSEPDFARRLRDLRPDCCPVVAYGALIPAEVLSIPAHGWVNVHFSMLPAWRGAAPVQRAILAGEVRTGISVFDLVPALDAGPVYRQEASELGGDETSGDVLARLAGRGAQLLIEVLDAIDEGTAAALPQSEQGVTLAPKLTVAEARIDWTRPAASIDRQIRACNPSPIAWTTLAGERFRVLRARPHAGTLLEPGELRLDKRSALAGTARGVLELLIVQPAGKRAMPAADWARGVAGEPGRFE